NAWKENEKCRETEQRFRDAMNDDFNTAQALAVLFDTASNLNIARTDAEKSGAKAAVAAWASLLSLFRSLLGLAPELEAKEEELSGLDEELMRLLIELRADARKSKQFEVADKI